MRADMSKIIVERPRRGSRMRNLKSALALDPARADDEVYADPGHRVPYGERKSLNENLAPLRRYLQANVGRPWRKVYSEIRSTLDSRKATGLHVLQHLRDMVAENTYLDGKVVMSHATRWCPEGPVRGLYVHPVTGLLRLGPSWRFRRARRPVSRIAAGPDAEFRLIGEVWHRFEYARRRPDEVAEVVRFHEDQPERNEKYGLTAPGDRRLIRYRDLPASGARYLARRRQCSRDELEWIAKRLKDQN